MRTVSKPWQNYFRALPGFAGEFSALMRNNNANLINAISDIKEPVLNTLNKLKDTQALHHLKNISNDDLYKVFLTFMMLGGVGLLKYLLRPSRMSFRKKINHLMNCFRISAGSLV